MFERGEIDGRPYFAMEYLGGLSLSERRGEFRTSARRAVAVIVEVAAGVQHAHDHEVYHRDLKAANVVFHDGRPVVTDFGCARWEDGELRTHGYALLGTPSHMAPEVWEHGSKDHDERADLWALGVMFYQLLAGELPFTADPRTPEGRAKLMTDDPAPIRSYQNATPGVDDRLEAIVRKVLSKNPSDRHPTVAAFAAELDEWLAQAPPTHVPLVTSRWRGAALIGGLTLLLAGSVAAIPFLRGNDDAPPDREVTRSLVSRLNEPGDSVTFINDSGFPVEPNNPLPKFVGTVTPASDGACEVAAVYLHFVKLFDEPFPFPVRLEADVAVGMTKAEPRVGLFAGEKVHVQPNGQRVHYAFAVAYGPGEQHPEGTQPNDDRLLSSAVVFAPPDGTNKADLVTMLVPVNGLWMPLKPPDPLPPNGRPGPTHHLAIDLVPGEFKGIRDGRTISEADRVKTDNHIFGVAEFEKRLLDGDPLGHGAGLFVLGGAGRFWNVRLTRLP